MSVRFAGEQLILGDGSKVEAGAHLEGKLVLLFFTEVWAHPTKALMQSLVEFYEEANEENMRLEIIVLSQQDQNASQAMKTFAHIEGDVEFHRKLYKEFVVTSIPLLSLIKPDGATVIWNAINHIRDNKLPASVLCDKWEALVRG